MQQEQKLEQENIEQETVEVELEDKKNDTETQEPEEKVETKSKDELEDYSSGVKNRIDKLTRKMREEERQKESAIQFVENVKKENETLKTRLTNLDKGYQEEFGSRVDSQLQAAKRSLKDAHDSGDTDKIVEAQESLATLTVEKSKLKKPIVKEEAETPNQAPVAPIPAQQPQQPAQNARPDPKAEAWANKNDWFGQDEVMTYASFGIHRRLVEDEGFDPTSDEYYSELDKRIASEFPHKVGQKQTGGSQKVVSATSSKSRNKGGKKTVRLSASQVAMAKRLGVPVEEYAKYVRQEA